MRIAILGWGSLIWDLDDLAPKVTGDWMMRAGPKLPLEFSRISPKRKMGLVVCLDPDHGAGCATHVISSARRNIDAARNDLAARERAPLDRIGYTGMGRNHGRMARVVSCVEDWCADQGWDGAVWTDLEPNFHAHTGQDFSLDRGHAYLKGLSGENLREAYRYIEAAPVDTKTPLRDRLSACPWWQGLKTRK